MNMKKSGMFLLAAPVFAVGLLAPSSNVAASPFGNSTTVCVPFHQTDQKCTRTFFDDNGNVISSNVYYINADGMWYLLP